MLSAAVDQPDRRPAPSTTSWSPSPDGGGLAARALSHEGRGGKPTGLFSLTFVDAGPLPRAYPADAKSRT